MEEVSTSGIFTALANVAKTLTFFSGIEASIKCAQPQVPIRWSINTIAVFSMSEASAKCSMSDIAAMMR